MSQTNPYPLTIILLSLLYIFASKPGKVFTRNYTDSFLRRQP